MSEAFLNNRVVLHSGDNRAVLDGISDCSIDSIVTDPPYALVSMVKRFGNAKPENENYAMNKSNSGYMSRGFMGKQWDTGETAFAVEFWAECLRVLKPGGHVVAFSGTRTYHRMACAIEDAGFEIRDQLQWVYGSGFPKSHDVSKGIDRTAGAEREKLAPHGRSIGTNNTRIEQGYRDNPVNEGFYTAPATDLAIQWQGWGTALKPACEPICLARKPLGEKTVAQNVLKWGCGAININGTRIHADGKSGSSGSLGAIGAGCSIHGMRDLQDADTALAVAGSATQMADDLRQQMPFGPDEGFEQSQLARGHLDGQEIRLPSSGDGSIERNRQDAFTDPDASGISRASIDRGKKDRETSQDGGTRSPRERGEGRQQTEQSYSDGLGRAFEGTPADGAQNVGANSREQAAPRCTCNAGVGRWPANILHDGSDEVIAAFPETAPSTKLNCIQAARDPKSKGAERERVRVDEGYVDTGSAARFFYTAKADANDRLGSKHPTVKPVDLMQWLVRLVTPKGGLVLDPFAGTGTTAEACFREGMNCILIEREEEYQADIRRRMALCLAGPDERARESIKAKTKDLPIDHGPLFGGSELSRGGADRFTATSPIRTNDWPNGIEMVNE